MKSEISSSELFYLLALQQVPNLGSASAKKLLQKVGSAEGVFKEKKHLLQKIDGIGSVKLRALGNKSGLDAAQAELHYIEKEDIHYTYYQDKAYPERLKHCLDGPILLFQKGNIDLVGKKIISIVGTRKLTTYGKGFCEKLVEALTPFNPVIVSGFAYGADIAAHLAAANNQLQTVACLAHGLNQIYPKAHKKYVEKLEENGGFVTEFWSSDEITNTGFLQRNRIIAGMSEATLVIESAERGGSLVTADLANSYNRDVFALPGRVGDSQSQGCNNLIKTNRAHLLSSAADVAYILNWKLEETRSKPVQKQLFVELPPEEQTLYDFLVKNPKAMLDDISLACQFPTYKTTTLLLNLELKNLVRPLPGKLYELL